MSYWSLQKFGNGCQWCGYQWCVGQSSYAITSSILSLDVLANTLPMRLKSYTEIIYYLTHTCALGLTRVDVLP